MGNPKVYLAGGITGLSYGDARFGWRHEAITKLDACGITGLSPMRGMDHLKGESSLPKLGCEEGSMERYERARAITSRDRLDLTTSDMVLFMLNTPQLSAGSCIELGWADILRIPVVAVLPELLDDGEPNPHYHAMALDIIGWRCETLDEALRVIVGALSAGV